MPPRHGWKTVFWDGFNLPQLALGCNLNVWDPNDMQGKAGTLRWEYTGAAGRYIIQTYTGLESTGGADLVIARTTHDIPIGRRFRLGFLVIPVGTTFNVDGMAICFAVPGSTPIAQYANDDCTVLRVGRTGTTVTAVVQRVHPGGVVEDLIAGIAIGTSNRWLQLDVDWPNFKLRTGLFSDMEFDAGQMPDLAEVLYAGQFDYDFPHVGDNRRLGIAATNSTPGDGRLACYALAVSQPANYFLTSPSQNRIPSQVGF